MSTMGREDLDETIPLNRDVEPTEWVGHT